jgi:signal peptidase II
MTLKKAYLIILAILFVDQLSKIYIKTHFILGEEVEVFSWFKILFVENEGMALGTKLPGSYGKLILTLFRIVAVGGIAYWLNDCVKKKSPDLLIVSVAMILAGAAGNILDSVFYGVFFNDSYHSVATLFAEQPYGTWLHGKVVDMFYFPLWSGYLPEWIPIWGGRYFVFFEYVFNVADAAISVAVAILLLFNKKVFVEDKPVTE